ncbi:hypothetical protein FVEN_g11022 [Fusarium venenatum]|nr:hypothetical protein FVEN_g11022 [Fusarium venenatum]
MEQQHSEGPQVQAPDIGGLNMSADNTSSRAVEKFLKDLDECQIMANTIKDYTSSVVDNVVGLLDPINGGAGKIRKLRDEMVSLESEGKASQKLQK